MPAFNSMWIGDEYQIWLWRHERRPLFRTRATCSATLSGTVLNSQFLNLFDLAIFLTRADTFWHTLQESVSDIVYFYFVSEKYWFLCICPEKSGLAPISRGRKNNKIGALVLALVMCLADHNDDAVKEMTDGDRSLASPLDLEVLRRSIRKGLPRSPRKVFWRGNSSIKYYS